MRHTRAPAHPAAAAAAPRYYHATTRIGPGLFLWFPIVGGIGALLLGIVYAFLAAVAFALDISGWLFLVTPFFAVGLALVGRWVCQLGNVRRRRLRLPIVLLVGAIGLYFAWHAYLNFISGPSLSDSSPTWRMSPARLWHAMLDLAADRGISSWLVWLLEAATVFGFIVYLMSGDGDAEIPFCEKCGHWTTDTLSFQLDDSGYIAAAEQFKLGRTDALRKLRPRESGARTYLQVRVLQCPCRAARFACLERITVIPGKKGGLRYGRVIPRGRQKFHYDLGSPQENQVEPLVANIEIDEATQQELEQIRSELQSARERETE